MKTIRKSFSENRGTLFLYFKKEQERLVAAFIDLMITLKNLTLFANITKMDNNYIFSKPTSFIFLLC